MLSEHLAPTVIFQDTQQEPYAPGALLGKPAFGLTMDAARPDYDPWNGGGSGGGNGRGSRDGQNYVIARHAHYCLAHVHAGLHVSESCHSISQGSALERQSGLTASSWTRLTVCSQGGTIRSVLQR